MCVRVENHCLRVDLKILWLRARHVLRRVVINRDRHATTPDFVGGTRIADAAAHPDLIAPDATF
jgi:hypothetical protein